MTNRLKYDEISSFLEKNCVITSTVHQVLRNLRENYKKFGKVTDDDLLALSSLFGATLEKALDIIEGNKITYFHTHLDAVGVYQVEGKSNDIYTIFPSVNYCPCPAYKYRVSKGSEIICKHVLATKIADAINKKQSVEVSSEHLSNLLLTSVSLKYMNDREDWNNGTSYVGQFMPPSPLQPAFTTGLFSGIPPAVDMAPNDWAQVPPQTMPWGVPPESQPSVVRFTAGDFNSHSVPVKRKCETSVDVPPSKMLVTEEKMAAHMQGLHISEAKSPVDVMTNMPHEEKTVEADSLPKLVLCDEIKNLKTESIIPESILKKLEKPEMALVLWQPPATDLNSKLRELKRLSVINKEKQRENELKDDGDMDVAIETEAQKNNLDSVFRPIDPVPMPTVQNQFFQPVPQFHGYSPFSQYYENNLQPNHVNRQ